MKIGDLVRYILVQDERWGKIGLILGMSDIKTLPQLFDVLWDEGTDIVYDDEVEIIQ
jgi:lipopolysaccharide/colanic/teichoic acid biosynthesis glycosyltransferase